MRVQLLTALVVLGHLFDFVRAESTPAAPSATGQGEERSLPATTTTSSVSIPIATVTSVAIDNLTHVDAWRELRRATQCHVDYHLISPGEDATTPEISGTPIVDQTETETVAVAATAEPEATQPVDAFVSFEEWKRMKEAEEEEQEDRNRDRDGDGDGNDDRNRNRNNNEPNVDGKNTDSAKESAAAWETDRISRQGDASSNHSVKDHSAEPHTPKPRESQSEIKSESSVSTSHSSSSQQASASPPPHHNRYNYASPDCSARIHSSSPQTQHASSLLHKSRDRYMLTPCKAKEHWVVVELCDEIRIEAVEVAVWEFFSGVVREVRVSVGGEDDEDYEDDPDDGVNGRSPKWKEVGSFIGKNIRGVQTFKLPQPTSFHRFIRLDFPSYFGTEYYCPVSQLKVYGMNQMEAFKWEQKRISAAAKEKEKEKEKNGSNRDKEAEERKAKEERELKERRAKDEKVKQEMREKELDELEKLLHEQAGRVVPDILTETAILSKLHQSSSVQTHIQTPSTKIGKASNPGSLSTVPTRKDKDISSTPAASSPTKRSNASAVVIESEEAGTNTSTRSSSTTTLSIASSLSSTGTTKTAAQSLKTITDTPVSTSTYSRSPPPRSDSSESIYAFIIRRLNALEGNSTLVARYIEEQAKVMRHMLTRVERGWEDWKGEWEGDDRGRWEQERMRQEDRLGRVISQLEQQKTAMEVERKEIQSQLRVLADELGYERRRGLAQLLIMFVIIVLGVITRSSTIDAVLKPLLAEAKRRRSMRKSFSGPLTGLRIDMGLGRPPAVIGQGRPRQESGAQLDQPSQRRADDRVLNGRGGENSGKQRPDARNEEDKARAASPASPTPVSVHRSRHAGNRHSISRRPGTPTSSSSMRQRRLPPGVISSNYRSVSATDTIPTAAFSPSSSSALPTSAVSGADGSGSGSGSVFLHSGLTSPAYKPQPRISLNAPRAGGLAGPSRRLARSAHLHTMEADKLRHELKAGKSRALSVAEPGPSGQSPSSSGTASSGHFGEADDGVHGAVDQTPKRSTSLLVDHQQHHVQSHSQPIHHGPFAPRSGPEHTLRLRENEISPFTVQLNDGRMPNALPIDTDEDRRDREYNLLGQNSDHGGGGNDRDHDTDGPSDWGTDVETEDSVSEVEVDVHHLKERKQPGQANESGMTLTSSQQAVIDELDGIWNGSGPNGVDVKVKTTGTHDADIKDLRKER